MVVFSRSLAGPTPSTTCKTVPIAVAFALVLRSHWRQVHFGSLTSDVPCGSLTSGRFIRFVHLFIVIPSEARNLSNSGVPRASPAKTVASYPPAAFARAITLWSYPSSFKYRYKLVRPIPKTSAARNRFPLHIASTGPSRILRPGRQFAARRFRQSFSFLAEITVQV